MAVAKAGALLVRGGVEHHFQERKLFVRFVVDRCFSAARLIRGTIKVRRHVGVGARGMNGFQGAPWSEDLNGKELHGAACGDLEPR